MRPAKTLHDVAALAGVSARTVSRVVNDEGGFGEDTKARVLEAIEQVGYRPNLVARALITKRSATIGLVGSALSDPFFAELAEEVQRALHEVGRTMFFASHEGSADRLREVLGSLRSHASEGAIVFPAIGTRPDLVRAAAAGLPIVLVDHEFLAPRIMNVCSRIADGAEAAVTHLIERGRRSIAMTANLDSYVAEQPPRREHGYRRALAAAGLPVRADLVEHAIANIEGGRAATRALLERTPDLDAVFAYNDLMALGVLQALAAAGRRVPDDVAVVGFNDMAIAAALHPALTSVRIDRPAVARAAVDLLTKGEQGHPGPTSVFLDVELMVRESS